MPTFLQKKLNIRSASGIGLVAGFMLVAAVVPIPGTSQASPMPERGNPVIVCEDEQLTVKATSVPLEQLLDAISKTCNLRIFTP